MSQQSKELRTRVQELTDIQLQLEQLELRFNDPLMQSDCDEGDYPKVSLEGVTVRLSGITQFQAVLAAMRRSTAIEHAMVSWRLTSVAPLSSAPANTGDFEAGPDDELNAVEP
jgi:hypothetical protein